MTSTYQPEAGEGLPVSRERAPRQGCGDGIIDESAGELCDDGDDVDLNACSNSCQPRDIGLLTAGGTTSCYKHRWEPAPTAGAAIIMGN